VTPPLRPLSAAAIATAVIALLAGARAQQRDAATPAPLLRVSSGDAELLQRLGDALAAPPFAWPVPAGDQHFVLELLADRSVNRRVVPAPMRPDTRLEVLLQPAAAVRTFERELLTWRAGMLPRLELLGRQFGYPKGFVTALADDLQALLPAFGGVGLRVGGDLHDAALGLTVQLELAPAADTPLQRWLQQLQPNPQGVPQSDDPGAVAALQLSLQGERLAAAAAPFLPLFLANGADDPDGLPGSRARAERLLSTLDGTLSVTFGDGMLRSVLGLRDPETFATLLVDQAHLEAQKERLASRRIDADYRPDALVHRDCRVLRATVSSARPTALLADDAMTTFTAVAGNLAVAVGAAQPPEAAIRAAIDAALDRRLPRRELRVDDGAPAAAVILCLGVDLERATAALPAPLQAALPSARPKTLRLHVYRLGNTLKLRLELR